MTKIEILKLKFYRERIGSMSSKEALMLALEAEQIKRDMGPLDITAEHFYQQQRDLTEYAELLEKEENEQQRSSPS
jgi:hypothetical protein